MQSLHPGGHFSCPEIDPFPGWKYCSHYLTRGKEALGGHWIRALDCYQMWALDGGWYWLQYWLSYLLQYWTVILSVIFDFNIGAGLHKIGIFVIQDNGISHFSQKKIPWNQVGIPKKGYLWQNKFLSQKQVIVTRKLFVTETNFFIKKLISFRKQVSITETSFCLISNKEIHFCIRKKSFCHRKVFFHWKKFLLEKNVLKNLILKAIDPKAKVLCTKNNPFCRHNTITFFLSQIHTIHGTLNKFF